MRAAPIDERVPPESAGFDERPSKTQRKKEMTALQALGTRLVALNAAQLAQVPLPDNLREAIAFAQKVTAHEARRRQLQYVGKLMRQVEPGPIEAALEALGGESRAAVALMHHCERWRDRLLDDDDALTELLRQLPGVPLATETQSLRSTIRAARRERDAGQPPKHARELYRWLHAALGAASSDSAD
jgi:ribosome-associated protein